MVAVWLKRIVGALALILLQVLVLNRMNLFGYATPFLYVYLLVKMDIDTPRYAVLLLGFFMGLIIDMFSNTMGVNSSATVLLAFCQPFFLRAFARHDDEEAIVPSRSKMGAWAFLKYLTLCVVVHHCALLMVEYFTFVGVAQTLLKVGCSSLLTICLLWAMDHIVE